MSIITNKIKDSLCPICGGRGCKKCNNTGKEVEYYSIYIDDETGIAFGSEPGK
jgi:transcription elongation factor Elf1